MIVSGMVAWLTSRPSSWRTGFLGRDVLVQARRERAAVVTDRLRSDPHHDEQDLATAVAVIRGLLDQPDNKKKEVA